MNRNYFDRHRRVPLILERLDARLAPAASALMYPGIDGEMVAVPQGDGDRIPDFSNVGYRGGGVPLPNVPVKATVSPGAGDDGAAIQAAINLVSALPLDANGFRGAVLLTAGEYQIEGSITIAASGVVLRGVGDDAATGTTLRATGTSQRTLVNVLGSGSRSFVSGTTHSIIDKRVPVGARSFHVDSTAGLAVGQSVIVLRPSTAEWIHDTNMDLLDNPWQPGSKDLDFDRVITRIEGTLITLDAPLGNAFEELYGGGTIAAYTWNSRIQNVGVEHLRGVSDYVSSTDEAHSWNFIDINRAQNVWVRNTTAEHFAYCLVNVQGDAKWVTVEDSRCLDPISVITGSRRYSFNVNGQLTLIRNCYARNGRHDFVNGSTTPGPNVFVDCEADSAKSDTGPHHRWSAATLFDNVDISGNNINVQNRGNSGTGHGWAGANMVIWNSIASGGFIVQNPPTAQNWMIGSTGTLRTGTMFVGPTPQVGIIESHNAPVTGRSLYYSQLQDRLKNPGLRVREYPVGDVDGYVYNGTSDNPPVDAAWQVAVDASTTSPLAGFDIGTSNTIIPFTFTFALAANERVVGATLNLGLRSTGTTSSDDVIRIDSMTNTKTIASLGGPSLTSTTTTGRLLDLSDQIALLQDGRLNLAIDNDTGVDWAVLSLRIAPLANETATLERLPVADTYGRGGTSADLNFGAETSFGTKKDSSASVMREAFLKFDVSGIVGTVVEATVRLVPTSVGGTVENAIAFVENDSWGETTLTWNNKPANSAAFASWTPVLNQPVEVAATPWVQEAIDGDGVLSLKVFSTTNIGGPGAVFYGSREGEATVQPKLILRMAVTPTVNGGAEQRSRVTEVTLDFGTLVNAATLTTLGAITLTRTAVVTGGMIGTTVATGAVGANGRILVSPATGFVGRVTLTFDNANGAAISAGVEHGSLADGRWQLAIPSLNYTSPLNGTDLLRLFGDGDNNGTTDGLDFAAFGNDFHRTMPDGPFDFNADGIIDVFDFIHFGGRFGMTV